MHRSLDESPLYNALSYYWGAAGRLATILLDGVEVIIRDTLHRFLRRLNSHLNPILVWLDALCINQDDISERNWQVSLMQEIYESAARVFAWLGEGDADCRFAMRYARLIRQERNELRTVHPNAVAQYSEQLFLQPYWSRIWVVQEVVLARQVWLLCGNEKTMWDDLMTAFNDFADGKWERTEPEQETEARSRFLRFTRARESIVNGRLDLLELAESFRQHNCVDPRDRLNGLRGLANNGRFCRVDYDQTTPRVLLDALRLHLPIVERLSPIALTHGSEVLTHALGLCSSIPRARADIIATLQ